MVRRAIRDFRDLHRALKRFYLRRARRRALDRDVERRLRQLTGR
jgi:hypothetical protein